MSQSKTFESLTGKQSLNSKHNTENPLKVAFGIVLEVHLRWNGLPQIFFTKKTQPLLFLFTAILSQKSYFPESNFLYLARAFNKHRWVFLFLVTQGMVNSVRTHK